MNNCQLSLKNFNIYTSTTEESAMVLMSPKSLSSLAIFLRTLLMILPDLVLGRPGADWMKSGCAKGAIFVLIIIFSSDSMVELKLLPAFSVMKQYRASPCVNNDKKEL